MLWYGREGVREDVEGRDGREGGIGGSNEGREVGRGSGWSEVGGCG